MNFIMNSRLNILIFVVCTLNLVNIICANTEDVVVTTSNGQIRGLNQGNYFSFEAIPYAEPPIGENRFEPPVPIKTDWLDIKNTTAAHPACLQWDHFEFDKTDKLVGVEDCLYIDVYTPSIDGTKLYPVIVYIHGGAFMFGAALNGWVRHDLIMKHENAVTIFMNYRLGPLGFLTTADNEIAGNMGLKDQRLALEWIRKNVLAFHGDPNDILLTGFSAGAASVHLQMLSPGLEELVSSAVSFSGTALCPWVMVPTPIALERTNKLASIVNCDHKSDTKVLKDCLKNTPADKIVRAVGSFHEFLYNPFRVFGPVIESKLVEKPFLTDDPHKLIIDGKTANIPWIVSMTEDEGGYNAAELLRKNPDGELSNLKEFIENFSKIAPVALFYNEVLLDKMPLIYTELLIDQFNITTDFNADTEAYFQIQKMFSAELFHNSILRSISMHSKFSKSPVYFYRYNNSAPYGCANILANRTDIDFGCVHGDDVFLIFNLPKRDEYPLRPDEEIISKNLIDMIVNFAETKTAPKYDNLELPKNKDDDENLTKFTYLHITRTNASIETQYILMTVE